MQYLVESGIFHIGLLFAFLIPAVLFLLTQQNTLKAIKPENRLMQPGQVWLQCIPVFGQFWQFFVISKIADSIRKEMLSLQDGSVMGFDNADAVEEAYKRPTFQIGMTYCILCVLNILLVITMNYVWVVLYLSRFQGLVAFSMMICWIIYWVRLARWKNKLTRATDLGFF